MQADRLKHLSAGATDLQRGDIMKKIPDNSILKKEFTIPFFNMKNMKRISENIKNKKKSKIYKRKRKTFKGLLLKNSLVALSVTVVFAVGLFCVGRMWIFEKAESYTSFNLNNARDSIERSLYHENIRHKYGIEDMRLGAGFSIVLDKNAQYQINSHYTENCHVFVRLTNEELNTVCSSRMALQTYIELSADECFRMTCDTENKDIPELQQLEEDYMTLNGKANYNTGKNYDIIIRIIMKSAYINTEENSFIPHETDINLIKYYPEHQEPSEILESKSYKIDVPEKDGYELIEFDLSDIDHIERVANCTYPRYFSLGYYGTDKKWFDDINKEYYPTPDLLGGWSNVGNTTRRYFQNTKVYIDGKPHTLTVVLQINVWNSVTKPLYFRTVALFLLAMLIIALLDAWRKNVRNQAEYMFEDYQKNLTDSLAHDLKTPLTAIGGYTENILSGSLSEKETQRYLNSIIDSVAYTDSIITRTLELSRINSINDINKVSTFIHTIVEKCVEKYSVILDERNITVTTDGQAEIPANTQLLETAIENLVSNAVKYTSGNGSINIRISSECLSISNTVNRKVDVEKLKRPFAKGDTSRSGQSGSGLGLAIAEKAALSNGFTLSLSCTDSKFTARLIF